MKIAVIGTGYVGLVTGTCFAETGVNVVCVDNDLNKVKMCRPGRYRSGGGLEPMMISSSKGRLHSQTAKQYRSKVIFAPVGTLWRDGSAT